MSDGLTTFALSNVDTYLSLGVFTSSMLGGFSVQSDTTDNRELHAEIIEGFSTVFNHEIHDSLEDLARPFETGEMVLTANDGSTLVLNSDNGDPASVAIDITAPDGTIESLVQPWSLWVDSIRLQRVFSGVW